MHEFIPKCNQCALTSKYTAQSISWSSTHPKLKLPIFTAFISPCTVTMGCFTFIIIWKIIEYTCMLQMRENHKSLTMKLDKIIQKNSRLKVDKLKESC